MVRGESPRQAVRKPEETKSAFSLVFWKTHSKFTLQMKFNPFNRQLLMRSAVESYYKAIGLVPDESRTATQVKARNAICVALLQWANNQQEVADLIGRDRSTVAHMMINHEDNMQYFKGYSDLYEKARLIVDSRMSTTSKADRLADICNKIFLLEQEAAILRNELNSIPNVEA
jgi:hypothetical protein